MEIGASAEKRHGHWASPLLLFYLAAAQQAVATENFVETSQGRLRRCATQASAQVGSGAAPLGSASDCAFNATSPVDAYDPGRSMFRIPVVVHVIQAEDGRGFLSAERVESQIDVLNEDFLALAGSPGAAGSPVGIEFILAQEDPFGKPADGITYTMNDSWFRDQGSYWNVLSWPPERYLNIFTNEASGAVGYVPFLPQERGVDSRSDRVVVHYSAFGRDAPLERFGMGRAATHEVGHYLGLFHVFEGACDDSGHCSTSGDRICDTPPTAEPTLGCASTAHSCGRDGAHDNYMNYSEDRCMFRFTPEQARRMRCTLEFYRSELYEPAAVRPAPPTGLVAYGGDSVVDLDWDDSADPELQRFKVYRSKIADERYVCISTVSASDYSDTGVRNGRTYYYRVTTLGSSNVESPWTAEVAAVPQEAGGRQSLGDCNQDGGVDISDAVCVFGFLFLGSPDTLPCSGGKATDGGNITLLDLSGDRQIDVSDGVGLLERLFRGRGEGFQDSVCVALSGCPQVCEDQLVP